MTRLGDFGVSTVLDIAKEGFEAWRDYERLNHEEEALDLRKKELEAERAALAHAKAMAEEAARERAASAAGGSSGGAPSPGGDGATAGGLLASIPASVLVAGGLGLAALVLYLLTRGRR